MEKIPASFIIIIYILQCTYAALELKNMAFTNCSQGSPPEYLKAGPCEKDPCAIKRGAEGEIHLSFTSNQDTKKVVLTGKAKKDGFLPVTVPKIDICGMGYLECPLKKDSKYVLKATGALPKHVPNGKYDGELWLEGESGRITCMKGLLEIE